jgi:cytochrome b561
MALICVHIVGVLYHEYVQGDRLLVRILPRRANEWWLRLSKPVQA